MEQHEISNFLTKLVTLLLENKDYEHLVSWDSEGKSFIIYNQSKFAQYVLPKYFKHNKFTSFVRQLNMYGFRKLQSPYTGGMDYKDEEHIVFFHPDFRKNDYKRLYNIKRKLPANNRVNIEEVHILNQEVQNLKVDNEDNIDSLKKLKNENVALKEDVAFLQTKLNNHENVINKMYEFMMPFLKAMSKKNFNQSTSGIERIPKLMIDNGSIEKKEIETNEVLDYVGGDVNEQLFPHLLSSPTTFNREDDKALETPKVFNVTTPNDFDVDSLLNFNPKIDNSPLKSPKVGLVAPKRLKLNKPILGTPLKSEFTVVKNKNCPHQKSRSPAYIKNNKGPKLVKVHMPRSSIQLASDATSAIKPNNKRKQKIESPPIVYMASPTTVRKTPVNISSDKKSQFYKVFPKDQGNPYNQNDFEIFSLVGNNELMNHDVLPPDVLNNISQLSNEKEIKQEIDETVSDPKMALVNYIDQPLSSPSFFLDNPEYYFHDQDASNM